MTRSTPFEPTPSESTPSEPTSSETAPGDASHGTPVEVELSRFFDAESFSRTAPTRARYRRVQTRLTQFLDDVDVTSLAGPQAAARLAAERERGRHGAFGRALGFEELLGCLGGFVRFPWLPLAASEQRTHISLTERLALHLRRRQLIDPFVTECLYLDVLGAIRIARWDFRARSPLTREDRLDDWIAGEDWFSPQAAPTAREIRGLRLVRDVGAGPQTRA